MPTKYDVFAKIIAHAPLKPKDLGFTTAVYAHIRSLLDKQWIRKNARGALVPVKNAVTKTVFQLISWSLKHNLNHNIWFSPTLKKILEVLPHSQPQLNPPKLSNNQRTKEVIQFLEQHQFILLWKLRPKLGTLLNGNVFTLLNNYYHLPNITSTYLPVHEITQRLLTIPDKDINPFDLKIFEFLAGSAQLEGSTVSIGETVDLLLHSIYPDKPSKDIQMVKNLNEAVAHVINHLDEPITLTHLKELNRLSLFTLHKGAGVFKTTQNKIFGNPSFKTTLPKNVVRELESYCNKLNNITCKKDCLNQLGFIHNQFQRIHPFVDGNSRTTRLIINWLLMKFKLPLLILKTGAFDTYMNLTKLSKKRDDIKLHQLLLHLIYHEEVNGQARI